MFQRSTVQYRVPAPPGVFLPVTWIFDRKVLSNAAPLNARTIRIADVRLRDGKFIISSVRRGWRCAVAGADIQRVHRRRQTACDGAYMWEQWDGECPSGVCRLGVNLFIYDINCRHRNQLRAAQKFCVTH